jgi:hypothetical protein
MNSKLRIRFSIRALLAMVAIVAFMFYAVQDWRRLQAAREKYRYALSEWVWWQVHLQDVAKSSESLMHAEAASIWISKNGADSRHLDRLKLLAQRAENRKYVVTFSDPGPYEREIDDLRATIDQYKSSNK